MMPIPKAHPEKQEVISVCGVVVHVHPDRREATESRMKKIPGLEIHGASKDGKLVVTVETDSYRKTGDAISHLQDVEGVLSVSMIYQHAEPLDESDDPDQGIVSIDDPGRADAEASPDREQGEPS